MPPRSSSCILFLHEIHPLLPRLPRLYVLASLGNYVQSPSLSFDSSHQPPVFASSGLPVEFGALRLKPFDESPSPPPSTTLGAPSLVPHRRGCSPRWQLPETCDNNAGERAKPD
jgi:hypothetical protein